MKNEAGKDEVTNVFFSCREGLCHVLKPKMDRYEKEKNGNQEVEEFLKTLLDNEVKPLWPKGWMQTRYETPEQIHLCS